jgi:hypothetical protein
VAWPKKARGDALILASLALAQTVFIVLMTVLFLLNGPAVSIS